MLRTTPRAAIALALLLAACGNDDRTAEARAATHAVPSAATDSVYGASATENVRLVPADVELRDLPKGWDGMRVAVISDLELSRWAENPAVAEAAARTAAQSGADVIALIGDYVERGGDLAPLRRVLAPLRGRTVVAVLGDDDALQEPGSEPDSAEIRLREVFREAGVSVLDNERFPFARGGDTAYIAGVEPFVVRRPEWRQAEILSAVGGSTVLLSQAPGILARLAVARQQFPLIIAGDVGCGAVPPPTAISMARLRGEILPGAGLPQDDRAFRVGQSTMLVTCGVGTSYIPVRLGAPPEVLLVTLRRAGGTGEAADSTATPLVPDSLLKRFEVGDDADGDTGAVADSATRG